MTNKNQSFFKKYGAVLGVLVVIAAFTIYFQGNKDFKKENLQASALKASKLELGSLLITIPEERFGFVLDTFDSVITDTIQRNQFLADILLKHGVNYQQIDALAIKSKDVFDIRQLRADKPFTLLTQDTSKGADYFIYEPNIESYVVYELKGEQNIELVQKPIEINSAKLNGSIESSLWQAMTDAGVSYELTAKMEDALQWSVDFHHINKGDIFNLVYDEKYVDGQSAGIEMVKAAHYKTSGNDYFAIFFDKAGLEGYYDEQGRPMAKTFLKAPVKYSRISSRYNLRRFHPVQKRVKPHLGTDYAAPYGTPIFAVADGIVSKKGYSRGNGNYVKLKHDKVYSTQYLHMQKFASGVNRGSHVKQGQVIGYVGSTGLATGPHVCFRFWKNGRQVNHLSLRFPPPDPLPAEALDSFFLVRDLYLEELGLELPKEESLSELDTTLVVN